MANEIDVALVTEFTDMVHVKAQQMQARLRPYVTIQKKKGDIWSYDGIGSVEATEVVGRIQPATFNSIDHLRRKIRRRRFVVNLPIDGSDVRGALMDPQSNYAQACVMAMARVFDRVGIEALFADVQTGRDFETTITAATDGVATVSATTGLTYNKLLAIKKGFTNQEVGIDAGEKLLLLITGDEEEALMKETQLISGDFSRQYVVDQGEMVRAGGFQLIKFGDGVANPMLSVSGGTRNCAALSTRGLVYGMSLDLQLSVEKRTDYIEVTQVQAIIQLGAVRTEGVLVQKVTTTDS